MTDSGAQGQPAPELYPQYCFHLSPTINKWCHLRAADIVALSSHPGFQGQDLYFHLNHPIKWVRICGIVVAIDVYGDSSSRKGQIQVITIDDSSGHTIECVIPLPPPPSLPGQPLPQQQPQQQPQQPAPPLPLIDSSIDIGQTLDLKGSLRTFREQRQVKVEKIVHLKTTEQEVAFWERVVQLRREVLNRPWRLEEKVVRRLRREAMGVDERDVKREREKEERRRERKRRWRLEEEGRRVRGLEGREGKGGEVGGGKEEEVKRMVRGLEGREEKGKVAEEEVEVEEREVKRRRRLEEERLRLDEERRTRGEGDEPGQEKRQEKERKAAFASVPVAKTQAQVVIPTRTKRNVTGLERKSVLRAPISLRPKEPTGLERKTKSVSSDRVVPVTGKYTALGL